MSLSKFLTVFLTTICFSISQITIGQEIATDYWPFGKQVWAQKYYRNAQGNPTSPSGQWLAWVGWGPDHLVHRLNSSTQTGSFDWQAVFDANGNANLEHLKVVHGCSNGKSYIINTAFGANEQYKLIPNQVNLQIDNGTVYDLTQVNESCNGGYGIIYIPYELWNQTYHLRVWGHIQLPNGSQGREFFWDVKYTPYQQAQNNCWEGTGSQTRMVIKQEEAWWRRLPGEQTGQWTRGSGPTISAGQQPVTATTRRTVNIAKDIGVGWTSSEPFGQCIKNLYSW